jgi:ATP-dependent Zn protease
MKQAMRHCNRPWWMRPPVWFIGIVMVALLSKAVVEHIDKTPSLSYSALLDQIDAGNIASVTFHGTEIRGRFKHPVANLTSAGKAHGDLFRSQVPDFGDPGLIPTLHKKHIAIDVQSQSSWVWLLGRLPWPMLIFVGVILIAGLVRLVRGGKAQPGTATPGMPAHGMIGLLSGLFAKPGPGENPSARDGGEPKTPAKSNT